MHVKRNKKDEDRLKSSKIGCENELIPRQTYALPSDRQRALDAEAEAEEVDEEEDEEGVARPVIERTIDEEAGTETIRTANKPQNGAMVLGLDPNAPQPLRVAAAKRPPRPADPVLAFLMNRMNPAKQEVIDVDADDEELQELMVEDAAMKKLEKKEKIKQETEQMRRKLSQSSTSTAASTEGLEEMQARDAYARQETRDHFLGPHSAREGSYAHESRKPFSDERRTYHRPSPEVSSLGCESAAPFEYKPAPFEQTDRMVWQPHHSPMVYDYKQARTKSSRMVSSTTGGAGISIRTVSSTPGSAGISSRTVSMETPGSAGISSRTVCMETPGSAGISSRTVSSTT
ncbi:hypothetical protein B484DRAFT_439137, partial [Ochromonadaceae sp. CCMP2298]